MKTVSATAEEIINSSGARWFTKFTLNGTDYINAISTFTLTNTINTNGNVSVGTTCASTLQFTIFDNTLALENQEITFYSGVALTYDDDEEPLTYEWLPIGVFKVVGATTEGNKTTFTAYDRMYYLLEQTYEPTVTFPTTNLLVLEDICTRVGISLATTISSPKTVSFDANVTMREMVGYMAMLECANAAFNEDGNLELRWYASADYELTADRWYSDGFTLDTSSSTTITRVDCTVTVDNVTTTLTSGSGSLPITLNNPYMTQTILDGIYTAVNSLSANCQATTIKFLGDLRLEVGDIVGITDNGTTVSRPIMNIENRFDGGLITTTNTYAFSETTTSVGNVTPITSKINKLSADIIETNKLVVTASEDIAELEGNIYVEGTTTINGGNIATNTIKADSIDVNDLFSQSITATNFNLTGGRIQISAESEYTNYIKISNGVYTTEVSATGFDVHYEYNGVYKDNIMMPDFHYVFLYNPKTNIKYTARMEPDTIYLQKEGGIGSTEPFERVNFGLKGIDIRRDTSQSYRVYYPTSGGTIALTSDIPTSLSDLSDFIITVTATGTDLNNYTTNGIYYFTTSVTPLNVPDDNANGYLFVFNPTGTTAKKQIWIRQSGVQYQTYVRTGSGSDTTWSDWVRYAVTDDITSAIASLDYSDSAVSGQYVSEVKETNGIISVKRAPLPTKLSDFTDDVVSGNYLSLSGGTMSGTITATNVSIPFYCLNSNGYTTILLRSSNNYGILELGSSNIEGTLRLFNNGEYRAQLRSSTLSANQDYYLPDASGTVALTSDLEVKSTSSGTDLNDYKSTGMWHFTSNTTPTNVPTNVINGTLIVYAYDNNYVKQIWYRRGTNNSNDWQTYVRQYNNTTWSDWVRYAVTDDITSAIASLDYSDSAVSGQYVSAVSETDGIISVTRTSLPTKLSDFTDDVVSGNYATISALETVSNSVDDLSDEIAINIIPFPYYESTEVQSGITFTNNTDGSVTVSGTSTSATSHYLVNLSTDIDIEPNTTYTLSGINGGSSGKYLLQMQEYNGSAYTNTNLYSGSITFTTKSDTTSCRIRIYVYSGVTVSETIYPMLEKGSVAHSYKQYCGKGTNVNEVLVEHNEKIRYIGDQSSASGSASVGTSITTLCALNIETSGVYIITIKVNESSRTSTSKYFSLSGSISGALISESGDVPSTVLPFARTITVCASLSAETLTLAAQQYTTSSTLNGTITVTRLA